MVTKWRILISRRVTKLACFLLIFALSFAALNRACSFLIKHNETGLDEEIMFSDIADNTYFYSRNMPPAYSDAVLLAQYGSEESIAAGEHIAWETGSEYWYNGDVTYEYQLNDKNQNRAFVWLSFEDDTPEKRREHEQYAINQQLTEFRSAKTALENTSGLLFTVKNADGAIIAANTDMPADYYMKTPAYFVIDSGTREYSHLVDYGYPLSVDSVVSDGAIYLAFTAEAVAEKNAQYIAVKEIYTRDFAIIGVCCFSAFLLLIVLLAGAGRRYHRGEDGIVFTAIDKPFLDISLALVICWILLILYFGDSFIYRIWRYKNLTALNLLVAAAAVKTLTPAILWLMSFAKRVKAGRFWRHTLIWFIPSTCWCYVKSLWAGRSLTFKVAVISLGSLVAMVIVAGCSVAASNYYGWFTIAAVPIALLTVSITVLLLRFALRIHALESGAQFVSLGNYDTRIDAGGGELGRIAESIGSISAGINNAVNERMKSERLKTELITNVSHDIRTPLTSIITYTDLLKNEGLNCEKAPEYLDILIQKSQRLKTLTDELFEAAKASSGNIDVNLTQLDLTALINQVLGELDASIKSSGLDFRVNLPERLPVMADGKLMCRVFENLLSNCIKHSLPQSRVYLDAELIGSVVRVDIKNISKAELNVNPSELTERFKRGDESRADGGSGLGLSIVQSFMTAQGGRFALAIDGDLFKASVFLDAAIR